MFVCVDDFSRYTWVDFIREKSDTFSIFEALCKQVQTEKGESIGKVIRIQSDHGREFENIRFTNFGTAEGISHEFSALITHNKM